jgi:regulator of sigma E protease
MVKATPQVFMLDDGRRYAALGYVPGAEFQHLNWVDAVGAGFDQTRTSALELVSAVSDRVRQTFRHEITPSQLGQSFGGPVMIARVSGKVAQAGIREFLWFLGMLSINLAIFNLVPLPVFDGGNIILLLVEVVRRKQLDRHHFVAVQLVGVLLILCLFMYLTYNDLLRLRSGAGLP